MASNKAQVGMTDSCKVAIFKSNGKELVLTSAFVKVVHNMTIQSRYHGARKAVVPATKLPSFPPPIRLQD